MKPATEILLSAAFVLTPEENWMQGWLARDSRGQITNETDEDAASFCMVGAIFAAQEALHCVELARAINKDVFYLLSSATGYADISGFNDSHTHAEVLDALYRAAELSEAS